MHYWGDEWFKEHGNNLYKAISVLEKRIREWAKMGVCGKEKWGAYQDEYLYFWDGGYSHILLGHSYWMIDKRKIRNVMWHIDHHLIPVWKTKAGWKWVGIATFHKIIGLKKLVNKWQERQLNKAFQVTCREFPDVVEELVCDVECYKVIKPCKWGNVDGEAIHKKYWKVVGANDYLDEMNKDTEKFV